MKNPISLLSLVVITALLIGIITIYMPKWEKQGMDATISYDVSGYYQYLPAAFIYHDLKNFSFEKRLHEPDINIETISGRRIDENHYQFQYPPGLAILYSPFFAAAHVYALNSEYKSNGYSLPYQISLHFGSVFVAFLGLFFLRRFLLKYCSDAVTAITLLIISLGTNYIIYASINAPQSHNYLFTLNVLILVLTTRLFDESKPKRQRDLMGLAVLLGLTTITRNTEIITFLFVLFFGLQRQFRMNNLKERFRDIFKRKGIALSVIIYLCIVSFQFIYNLHSSGSLFSSGYGDQGFSFLKPHIIDCLFSARAGWIIYSPLVLLMLIGFYPLAKFRKSWFLGTLIYLIVFAYVHFSWDIWWYGGSVGQRTMIQTYPFLALPLATLVNQIFTKGKVWLKTLFGIFVTYGIVHSLWIFHATHKGHILIPPQVTKEYLWKVYGKLSVENQTKKLLDSDELYEGPTPKLLEVFSTTDTLFASRIPPHEPIQEIYIPLDNPKDWLRLTFTETSPIKEWTTWKQPKVFIEFYNKDRGLKSNFYRPHRQFNTEKVHDHFFDVEVPKDQYPDQIRLYIDNLNTDIPMTMWNIRVYTFEG